MKERAPSPTVLADAIRKTGELAVRETEASLTATDASGDIIAFFEIEGGQWRAATGPMVLRGGPSNPANETRVTGADIMKHPIGPLALQWVDLIHAGKIDEAVRMASSEAQAKWKAQPANERKEIVAYWREHYPIRAQLATLIESGGILIIEGDSRAMLNLIRSEQKSTAPGVVTSTSTTEMIPFVMENGQWKLAQ